MAKFLKRERDSHWYHKDGRACHEVPYADPSKGMRPTTLRDAKKLNLVPSVTNILQIKAKPGLDVWKLEQAILASLTLPRKAGETEDEFVKRIADDMEQEASAAAEWGTAIHEQIESYNQDRCFSGTGEILNYVAGYETWYRANVDEILGIEESVVHPLGYAGRLDIRLRLKDGRTAVVDIKSQKLKGKLKPAFYKEWAIQLAAYKAAHAEPTDTIISLVIPSDAPGPAFPWEWDDSQSAWEAFQACHRLWCWDKDYTP